MTEGYGRRLRVIIHGAVQGVGFRPFVYRLASNLDLAGWVINDSSGVQIEVEGPTEKLRDFQTRLEAERPPLAVILSLEGSWLDPVGFTDFRIEESAGKGVPTVLVLPDVATCSDCRSDIFETGNRRHGYPFTNCTNCGPRYSIISGLPYDRPMTTMARFPLCPACDDEYKNPEDRRFHAQPNACPTCGPKIELWEMSGEVVAGKGEALREAAKAIQGGKIVALKGLGGYQLLVDAGNEEAVARLRKRKHREEKPLAIMFPHLKEMKKACRVSPAESRLLLAPESPIVLLGRKPDYDSLASNVAPGNPYLGAMLPYTPLHHLLMAKLDFPVVATSGNLSEEPMAIDEQEALERLGGIADAFLVHDRPILRHVDDSIVRIVNGRELVLRRARGYAPLPLTFSPGPLAERLAKAQVLAVGAHLKNSVVLATDGRAFLSQHIGDLATTEAYNAFERVITDLSRLLEFELDTMACDLHPDYLCTRYAEKSATEMGVPLVRVQHHEAHIASAMAENDLSGPVLGVAWDGTGYGTDGTVWGGEFLVGDPSGFTRVGHLRPFRLPGGDMAAREPRRSALALLHDMGQEAEPEALTFSASELATLTSMLDRGYNAPVTTSAGRLFDGVSALLGLKRKNAFEGQAAMSLEFALPPLAKATKQSPYPMGIAPSTRDARFQLDWGQMVEHVMEDRNKGVRPNRISARFHNGLVEGLVSVAHQVNNRNVVLSGGCFQNLYLTERTIARLVEEGFAVYTHQRVPPNDGGIALGQAVMAAFESRG